MSLQCIIVTPERTVLERPADFVVVTLFDGEIGVWPSRAPFIGRLGYGEMRVTLDDNTDRYYIEGGFIEVLEDAVTVLTGRAVLASEIDEAVALEQLITARAKPANTPVLMDIRDRAVMQSRAQLHAARRG
ncbi:MAG: F0F1 ATP synthase subunit epsilon [Thermoguttaceae bacterium]